MDKIKLSNHIKQGDTFYTPFTDPNGIGKVLSISSWAKSWLPEFLWIAIIIHEQGRKKGCETIYKIIEQLNESKIAVPQMSKIFALEKDKQELFWRVVSKYIQKDTLAHLTVVITPDVNEIFYNQFFDFTMNVGVGIIITTWVATGIERPYKVPDNVTSPKDKEHKVRIRYNSNSVVATPEQEKELYAMAAREPFDMVGNPRASIDDISEILLMEHLKATGSKLAKQVRTRGVEEILDEMQLLSGPKEMQRIRNVALMMFCENPDKFFPYMEVDIVKFPEGSINNPNSFIEVPPIKGAVPQIIKRTLDKIQDMTIENMLDKVSNKVETETSVSYPINAIKEAVVNAFYHKLWKAFHN